MNPDPEIVERLKKAGISCCVVCGKPIIRQVKQVLGRTGKYRRVWSQRAYCSAACEQKAYRRRRKIKKIPQRRL